MTLQRQLLFLTCLALVFAGLLAFRVVPEIAGWNAAAAETPTEGGDPGPKILVIEWSPPKSALQGSFEARKALRPDTSELEEVSDGQEER